MIKNEHGVSEVVGALLILLVLVFFLGNLQVYEVPKWNTELEMRFFDQISYDFSSLQSDIDLVAAKSMPIKSRLDLGVRYPEHYLLQNPGPGASGTLTFENVSIVLQILNSTTGSVIISIPLNSSRIRYKLNGITQQPELVYEHGLIIKDYGNIQTFEGGQSILSGNNLNVPIINFPRQSIGGMETETFTILPPPASQYNTTYAFLPTRIRLKINTSYPQLWNGTMGTLPEVSVNSTTKIITIDKNVSGIIFPKAPTDNYIYSGSVSTIVPDTLKPGGVHYGATGPGGTYSNQQNANNLVAIPPSSGATQFLINDIQLSSQMAPSGAGDTTCTYPGGSEKIGYTCFRFTLRDSFGTSFSVAVTFSNETTINSVTLYNATNPSPGYTITDSTTMNRSVAGGINLTTYYQQQNLAVPNSITIDLWGPMNKHNPEPGILYFRWVIN